MGGKASLAARLRRTLEGTHQVLIAPSVQALLANSGLDVPKRADARALLQHEAAVVELQSALESALTRAAEASGQPTVIVYDRGVLDPAAFLPREQWPALTDLIQGLYPSRDFSWYTCIVHLDGAAAGARAAFEAMLTRNGIVEAELPAAVEEALQLDAAIAEIQGSHPNYVRVDNSTDFEEKLSRAVTAIVEHLDHAASDCKGI
jgi:hypothetical protein